MAVLNTPRTPLLDSTVAAFKPRVVSRAKREYGKRLAGTLKRHADTLRSATFATVGFGSPVVAAFQWQSWAGWCALGVAALLWDKAVNDGQRPE
jgi:hypothetical protein